MAIQMTRAEYEAKYGVKPVFNVDNELDITSAPIRMTQAEYDAKYRPEDTTNKGLLGPSKDALQGLGTLYGGGEQGIASKLKQDVMSGSSDIQKGMEIGGLKGIPSATKGLLKSTIRPAGDIMGAVFAPIGATLQATGANKLFDYLSEKLVEGGPKRKGLIQQVTDIPAVQNFAITHPNAGEDFSRVMNLAFAKSETGKIEPKTAIPRTIEQVKGGVETVKNVPKQIQTYRETKASKNISDEIFNIENNYVKSQKANTFEYDSGKASRDRIAQTDVLSKIVNEDGKISIGSAKVAAKEYLKQTVDGSEGVVRNLLKKEGEKVNIGEVAKALTEKVYTSGLEGAALIKAIKGIKNELEGLKARADEFGNVELAKIHDAKISETQNINYKTDTTPTIRYKKAKASAYKELVEKKSKVKVEGKYSIEDINKELGKYLSDAERIENLGGKGVKGSKLGKYTAQISGNIIGTAAGAAFGPAGLLIGPIVGGEAAGFLKGKQMASTFGKPTGRVAEQSAMLERAKVESQQAGQINLKVADPKLGVPKNIPKTKEMVQTESAIKKNVEQQKSAIKAGNFELVSTLKEIYQVLVQKLKDLIKETVTPKGGQKGAIRNPFFKETKKGVTPESVGKKMDFEDREIANRILRSDSLTNELMFADFKKQLGIENLSPKDQKSFLKEAIDYSNSLGSRNTQYNKTNIPNKTGISKTIQPKGNKATEVIPKEKIVLPKSKLYHGSDKDFAVFDLTKAKTTSNYGQGIYFSDNPKLAEYYSTIKTKKADLSKASIEDLGNLKTRIGSVKEIELVPNAKIKTLQENPTQSMIAKAKADGFDGVKFKDTIVKEDWDSKVLGEMPEGGNTTLIFNEKALKQPTQSLPKSKVNESVSSLNDTTLIKEAKKYKSAEEFIKTQGTPVYHGGAGAKNMTEKLNILTPEEKLKYPSSGGGYIGLSTTDVKSYAEDIAQTMTGSKKDIAEFYINPKAKVLDIKDKHVDDFSADELEKMAKKYDVIKSNQENEYRIITENGVLTRKQLEDIWEQSKK